MSTVPVVALHPVDESLGRGGTLLRQISEGNSVHWLVVTIMTALQGFSEDRTATTSAEIDSVASAYGFFEVQRIGLPTRPLATLAVGDLISAIGKVFQAFVPIPVTCHIETMPTATMRRCSIPPSPAAGAFEIRA